MADIILKQDGSFDATYVPNTFIDKYMTHADGEFVKIYLYLLRCMNQDNRTLSVSDIADKFDNTERDVQRALKYWEKMRLLQLEYKEDELSGICLTSMGSTGSDTSTSSLNTRMQVHSFVNVERQAPVKAAASGAGITKEQLAQFSEDETIQELMFVAERYLGHQLSCEESRSILYWLDTLGFSQDMIDYLLEYCVAKNCPSIKYMNKIAMGWAKQGIQTLTEARESVFRNSELVHAIMRAYGICDRTLTDVELESVREWLHMGFSNELIVAACQKTMATVHKASFGYTNKILLGWKEQNVRTLNDVKLSDAKFKEKQKKHNAAKQAVTRNQKNMASGSFHNFTQRTYDYDKLEQELLTR